MFKCNSATFFSKNAINLVRDRHRAVMSARTAQSDCQAVLALLDIIRDQTAYDLCESVDELLRDVMLEHILRDLFVVAGQILKARHVIRIWNEAHVQHPVSLQRNAMLIAERHKIENKGASSALNSATLSEDVSTM